MHSIEEIKAYMKENNISYQQLTDISGVPLNTLKNIFRGKTKNPRIDTIQAIERALGLDAIQQEPNEEEQWRTMFNELTEEELEELTMFVGYLIAKRDKKKPHHNGRANN